MRSKLISFFTVLGIILLSQGIAYTLDFDINPIRIFFNPNTKAATLTLKNRAEDDLTFQLKVYKWFQDAVGEDIYEETSDIIIFPKIVKVRRGEERLIRIGAKVKAPEKEKTYRIYIEQIPIAFETPEKGSTVQIVMKMGVPVFITPLKAVVRGKIESFTVERGKIEFRIKNDGNSHFIIQTPEIKGRNPKGEEIFSYEFGSWYLLSGISRLYSTTISQEVCKDLAKLDIEVKTDRFKLNGKLDVDQTMCLGSISIPPLTTLTPTGR